LEIPIVLREYPWYFFILSIQKADIKKPISYSEVMYWTYTYTIYRKMKEMIK